VTSLFISYSRKDKDIAQRLTECFKEQKLDFWIDWEGIPPSVDWWKEIEEGIETADIFVFLLSPDSASSPVCGREVDHAVRNGKRLIPVVLRSVAAGEVHDALRPLNWIYLRDEDNFQEAIHKLLEAINTDYGWVRAHRELQVKALEWERSNYRNDLLLQGEELQEAESRLSIYTSKEPYPTDLQRDYVLKSKQASSRRRRIIRWVTVGAMLVLSALTLAALYQAGLARSAEATAVANAFTAVANEKEARHQTTIANSRLLAASSILNKDKSQLSTLFAVEAVNSAAGLPRSEQLQAEQALRDALGQIGGIPLFQEKRGAHLDSFSPDGRWLVIWANEPLIHVTDLHYPTAEPVILQGCENQIIQLDFSPDGRWLGTACDDGTAHIWDTRNLSAQPRILKGYTKSNVFAFSPDGHWLASYSPDEPAVVLWDLQNFRPTVLLSQGETEGVASIAFSSDSNRLVVSSTSPITLIWNLQNDSEAPIVLQVSPNSIGSEISPDHRWLLATGYDSGSFLWDLEHIQAAPIALRYEPSVQEEVFNFTPDGHWLIVASRGEGLLRLWDLHDPVADPVILDGIFLPLAVSSDGKWLAANAGSYSVLVDLQDLNTKRLDLTGHTGFINTITFSPDGRWLATGSADKTVRLWDMNSITSKEFLVPDIPLSHPVVLRGHEGSEYGIDRIGFSPDDRWLLSLSNDGMPRLWDLYHLSPEPLVAPYARAFTFSRDGQWFATEDLDHAIRLFDLHDGTAEPLVLRGPVRRVTSILFSPDGRWLAGQTYNNVNVISNTMYLWDLSHPGMPPLHFGEGQEVLGLRTFSPDGRWLVTAGERSVQLWAVDRMEHPAASYNVLSVLPSVSISPDSHWLIIAVGKDIRLVDIQNRFKDPILVPDPPDRVTAVAISPDGHWLVIGDFEGDARVLDLQNTAARAIFLRGHTGYINVAVFSPDSRWLATGSYDQTLRVWDMKNPDMDPLVWHGYSVPSSLSTNIAFSPDGHWLGIAGGGSIPARLWDFQNPKAQPVFLYGHEERATYPTEGGLAFSPNGRWLATWSGSIVRLWDMQDLPAEPILLKGHENDVNHAEFDPSGQWLATTSLEQTLLWDMNVASLQSKACQVVGRNFSREEWALYFANEPYRVTCPQWRAAPEATPVPSSTP
jgi:WD40 repeat protein